MNARQINYAFQAILFRRGINVSENDAAILRLAEKTLHRWHEGECGNSDNYKSWNIEERDDGSAWMNIHPYSGKSYSYRIPNRAKGARARVAELCKREGLFFFVQTDPRGCALYVAKEPLTDMNYSSVGVCCAL